MEQTITLTINECELLRDVLDTAVRSARGVRVNGRDELDRRVYGRREQALKTLLQRVRACEA